MTRRDGAGRMRPAETAATLDLAEEQAQFALAAAGLGTWRWEMATDTVVWSPGQEALHGLAPGTFGGTYAAYQALIHPADRERVIATVRGSLAERADHQVEYRTVWPDGTVRWIVGWGRVLRDAAGEPTGLVGVAQDVTNRRQTEDELRQSRNQLAVVLDGVADGITLQAVTGEVLFANDAAARIVGYPTAESFLAAPIREVMARFAVLDETGAPLSLDRLPGRRALAGELPAETRLRFRVLATGEERWSVVKATPVVDDQGRVRFAINVFRDVTEEHRAEQALRESEARYRLLFEANPHPMWVFDLETLRFLAVNDAAVHQYGWSRDEFFALTLLDVRPPEDQAAIIEKVARVTADPAGLDVAGIWRHRRRDGTVFDAEVMTHAIEFDGRPARLSLAIDVTDRQRAEAALRESEERFRQLADNVNAAFWISELEPPDRRMVYVNPAYDRLFGLASEGLYADRRSWLHAIHPADQDRAETAFNAAFAGPDAPGHFEDEYRIVRPDGSIRWVRDRAFPVRNDAGEVYRVAGITEDVTDRKQAEAALRESESRFRQLADNVNSVFWLTDPSNRQVLYVSPAFHRLWGLDPQLIYDDPEGWTKLVHPEDRARAEAAFLDAATSDGFDEEYRFVLPDGSTRWVRDRGFPIRDGSQGAPGPVYRIAGIAEDITERRQAEERFRFLAEAGEVLSSSLDYQTRLETVARLVVPDLADWCVVDILEPDGLIHRLAIIHRDPARSGDADTLRRRYPVLAADSDRTVARVIATGRPWLDPHVAEERFVAQARDPEHLGLLRRLGFRAEMVVPMVAHGRVLGTITMVLGESRREYDAGSLAFAEELARRCAAAVDNARLYQAAQTEVVARQSAEAELRRRAGLLDQAYDAIFAWKWDGSINFWNQGAERLYGFPAAEAIGRTSHQLLRTGPPPTVADSVRALARDGRWEGELEHTLEDGRRILVESRQVLVRENGAAYVLEANRDITDRTRHERRLGRLYALTAALSAALDPAQVARVIVDHARATTGAEIASVAALSADGREVTMLHMAGFPPGIPDHWRRFPLTAPTLAGEVVRTRAPIIAPTWDEFDRRFPHLVEARRNAGAAAAGAGLILPLLVDERPIGALGMAFPLPHPFSADDLDDLRTVANLCAQALERAQLYETERQARLGAEAAEARFRATFEQAAVGVAHRSLDGRWLRANQKLCDIVGYPRDELLTLSFRQITYPPDLDSDLAQLDRLLAGEIDTYTLEKRYVRKDGPLVWVNLTASLVRDPTGTPEYILAVIEDIAERKRDEERQRFLADASAVLSSSLDYEVSLGQVARLAVPRLADLCLVDVLRADETVQRLVIAHADPAREEVAREIERRFPLDPTERHGAANVLRTGRAELLAPGSVDIIAAGARDADHLALLRRLGVEAQLAVPLVARGRTLGVLTLAITGSGRGYGPDDLELAEEVARRTALAIDNARLFAGERQARQAAERATARTERLQALTAALAEALTPAEVAEVAVAEGIAALGGSAGAMALPTDDGTAIAIVRDVGYPPAVIEDWRRFPIEAPVAFADAIRDRRPVLLGSRAELLARYPHAAAALATTGSKAFVAFPLLVEGRAVGALGFSFAEHQALIEDDLAFLRALADQAAQALERTRLYEAERRARDAAERARHRLTFLAESSATLASSLDYEDTLRRVAELVVPTLADWCTIHVVNAEGVVERLVVAHADPARVAWAEELQERYPSDPDAARGVPEVLRTGRAELYPVIDDAMLVASAQDPEHLAMLRGVGIASAMIVPLVAHGQTLGAISFAAAESRRHYGPEDLTFADELAHRCAVAVDNARLYREARDAVRARDEFLSVAAHELRTPVTTVKGYAQMLLRAQTRSGLASERATQFLQAIDESTDRLRLLADDLLDVSRLRLGQLPLRPRPLDLTELAAAVVERYREQVGDRHRLTLAVRGAPGPVVADPDRTEQILSNLLDNAAKYSPAGGAIAVAVEPDDGGVRLSVQDEGIGLPVGEIEAIFEPFNRASNAVRDNVPGMGLGLYICRSIAERHGGRIWAESAGEGHGTTLRLWLPAEGAGGRG